MEKPSIAFFLRLVFAVVHICATTGEVSHCNSGVAVKDLLKLARINEASAETYAAKLKQHKIDQTVLGSLTLQQLQDIGITALGDRLRIFNFFSKDTDDCASSPCQNEGLCRDGHRCFSCTCDPNGGYYGLSCDLKCPCLNSGVCKTTQTGDFECVCPAGYSGDLCNTQYLTEERLVKLEETLQQLTTRLEQSEEQIRNQGVQIKNQEALIKAWDAKIKTQDAEIKDQDAQIKNLDIQFKNQEAQITRQDTQIKAQGAQIKNHKAQIKNLDAQFKNHEAQIKNQDAQIKNQDSQIKNQDAQIKNLDAQNKNQDAQIKNQDAQIKNQDAQIKNQDSQIKNQDSQIKNQDSQIKNQDAQIKNQDVQIRELQSRPTGSWKFYRANEVLNQLEKMQLNAQTPTYTQRLRIDLPTNTKAILISIYCHFYNHQGHAYLNYVAYQKNNDNAGAKAEGYNTHYDVYANTFYYEQMIPWNTTLPKELVFRVTYSSLTGGRRNWYRVRLVGYVTAP